MSNRVKGHQDHTSQSIFHHGFIKFIISISLQREGKTWNYFLFWTGFQIKQEEQQTKKQVDKGKTLVRKLGQKIKFEDKKEIKLEEAPEPLKDDNEPQRFSAESKGKYSLCTQKEDQTVQDKEIAEAVMKEKIAIITEQIAIKEENIQVRQRIPITILSEDEGYMLEEDESIAKTEARVGTVKEFSTLENKTVRPRKNKNRVEVMEFSTVKHQGRILKMMGELTPAWRPKTRPRNKLRLSMKKLLNPSLNTKDVTVLDDVSSDDEKPKSDKVSSKKKKEAVVRDSALQPAKGKKSSQSVEDSSHTEIKLSVIFVELRNELLK